MTVWSHIVRSLEGGEPCALVTVATARGSTPRETGARMVVWADGRFSGTIGGGTLEFEALRWARQALAEGRAGLELRTVSLGPDLGQCCGGRIDVAIEALEPAQLPMAQTLAGREAERLPFATRAHVRSGKAVERALVDLPKDPRFRLEEDGTLVETFGAYRRPLYLFGAGHVGKALVLALAPLPFEITWLDSREDAFPKAVPGNVRKLLLNREDRSVAECLAQAPDGAFVLAMTHSHALDEDIMAASLAQQRFAYCGVIGSATKRARFEKRLKARGFAPTVVSEMACPVGLPAIRSKHPAAIAAGIAADLLERDEAAVQETANPDRVAWLQARVK
ncbi:xanthine dehydrogenase accessory protein XdhC [Roseibium aggregatum]|uniref:Xanthine dehydrogenase accessory protein XdhC n=1 Tax=Roseibium aggregatum TaxID=187304 RepID=A0A926NY08_9HYPH|nr:xanthine dehydrogenase accessory protein XdhC [Roseibium aggregatum]MBD1546406.1 xanthine dehydrogenase accessory protein XdhC [Roseibium aggregatum]